MRRLLFVFVLCSPGLIPLLAHHLPFQDWPGHLGVIGALVHRDDPAARILEYFDWKGWMGPNRLFYLAGYALAELTSPAFGPRLLLALCLGALGPAAAWFARSAGADERLALFALPIALGRHVYCGFALNAAALVFVVASLAAYFTHRGRPTRGNAALFFGTLLVLAFLHSFFFLVAVGLIGLLLLADLATARGGRRTALVACALVALASLGLAPQLTAIGARSAGGPGLFEAVWIASRAADRSGLEQVFWEWLFASYRYATLDDRLQAVWALLFGAVILIALVFERTRFFDRARLYLLGLTAVTLAMFVFIPSTIGPPLNWWGGNLRLPPIVALLLIPLAGTGLRRLGPWPWRVVGAVSAGIVLTAAADLVRFDRTEMDGLSEVIEAMPPGQKIAVLHYTPREVHEYPGEPHGYVGNYYLLEKGGLVQQNLFEVVDIPFSRKVNIPAPPWGIAGAFDWGVHGVPADGFLVRRSASNPDAPFTGELAEKVELVKSAGNWRYYRRL